jgi:AcrR family transcriptional regulator
MKKKEQKDSPRVERKKEQTREKIITIAMDLFRNQGVSGTTMEQIAREVDIAKGTLYNYFPVKEAIIDEYIKRTFGKQNPDRISQLRQLPDTKSRIIMLFTQLIKGIQSQKEIFEKYLVYRIQSMISFHQDDSKKSGLYLVTRDIIETGQKSGELRKDLPAHILEELIEFAFIEVVKHLYMKPETFESDKIIEKCAELFLNGAKKL